MKVSQLEHLADVTMGQSPNPEHCNIDEKGLPFLQGCAEFGDVHPASSIYCSLPLRMAKQDSVLMSVRAPVGTMNYADQDYCIGRGLGSFRAKPGIADTVFLRHAVEHGIRYLHERSQGSTFAAVSTSDVRSIPIPFFLLDKQIRIAKILKTIDQAIGHTSALIEKYQQIKSGLMYDLFTRGIGADGKLRPSREQAPDLYQQTPIGWIPKEWQYELLDNLSVRGSGHTPSKSRPEYWGGGIKWVSLADSYRLDNLYIRETDYEISILGIQNSSAVLHPAGIVVLSRDAGIGKSAITSEPMAVSQHFICWRCDHRLDNHFLYYWLQNSKRNFENIAMGSTILTIGLSYFKRLRIACPKSVDEQRTIAERLKSVDIALASYKSELDKCRQQKAGLMHDLLTGKVQVTPDPEATHG